MTKGEFWKTLGKMVNLSLCDCGECPAYIECTQNNRCSEGCGFVLQEVYENIDLTKYKKCAII